MHIMQCFCAILHDFVWKYATARGHLKIPKRWGKFPKFPLRPPRMVFFFSEVSKRGWREGVGDWQGPKCSKNCSPELCPPSPKGGIRKRMQKRCLSLCHRKTFLAPTPSVRQPFSKPLFFFVIFPNLAGNFVIFGGISGPEASRLFFLE